MINKSIILSILILLIINNVSTLSPTPSLSSGRRKFLEKFGQTIELAVPLAIIGTTSLTSPSSAQASQPSNWLVPGELTSDDVFSTIPTNSNRRTSRRLASQIAKRTEEEEGEWWGCPSATLRASVVYPNAST